MRVVTIPNWSFARERALFRAVADLLEASPVLVHDCSADYDHNRTVTAFSGTIREVQDTLQRLAKRILPSLNLNTHVGEHPRIGGLDVCPFVPLVDPMTRAEQKELEALIDRYAQFIADEFEVPVFLYEKSEKGRHEASLPDLRRGGFGALLERDLAPDYGPLRAHPYLGATVMGWRDFLVAMNVNLATDDLAVAKGIAKEIRRLRQEGDPRFLGVRALGMRLATRHRVQVSMNLTLPDITPWDPIVDYIRETALAQGVAAKEIEFIGVILDEHDDANVKAKVKPAQRVSLERRQPK